MKMTYFYSDIPISADASLPTFHINLPTNITRTIKGLPLSTDDFSTSSDSQLQNELTSFGGIFKPANRNAVFNKLSYRILQSNSTLVLSPLLLNNSLNLSFQKISFQLPDTIKFNCFTITELSGSENGTILIDILTENNVLITIRVSLKMFIKSDTSNLLPSSFYQWCKYSVPYAFDVRKPLEMKAISPFTILLSLADSGLLKMSRPTIFDDFLVVPFSDTSYLDTFRFRLFRSNKSSSSIPEHIELYNEKVSTKSVLSFTSLNDTLITLSIDKKLKFWSISSLNLLKEYDLNQYLPKELHEIILNNVPSDFLHIINNKYLSCFLPIGPNLIKIFEITDDSSLNELYSLQPPLTNLCWSYQSYKISEIESKFNIWISWCFNTSRFIQHGEVINQEIINWSNSSNGSLITDSLTNELTQTVNCCKTVDDLNQFWLDFIFDGFNYSNVTLQTVVSLFNKHYNLDLSKLSLRNQITTLISHNISEFDLLTNLKKQWIKFDNTCKEVHKSSQDTIAIELDNEEEDGDENAFVIVMKASEYSIVKKSSPFELLSFNDTEMSIPSALFQDARVDTSALLSLFETIKILKSRFTKESLYSIGSKLNQDSSSTYESQMTNIFQSEIVSTTNQTITSELLLSLNNIPNVMQLFEFLIQLPTLNNVGYSPIKNVEFGNIGESLFISSLRSNIILQKDLIYGLLLITLSVDINDAMVELYSRLIKLYRGYCLMLDVLKFGLNGDSLELNVVPLMSKNFLLDFFKNVYEGGVLIRNGNLNYLINYSVESMLDNSFVYSTISKLISFGLYSKAILFFKYLPSESPISSILKGLALMNTNDSALNDESFEIFMGSVEQITKYSKQVSKLEKTSLLSISNAINLILTESPVDYFYDLSILYQTRSLDKLALQLALQSLSEKTKLKDTSSDQPILIKIFNLGIKLNEFKLCHEMISKMDKKERKYPIKQFVYKLFQINKIKLLLDYEFNEDFDTVDSLIFNLGESSALNSDLKNSLKYYRACYTLRLQKGDFRSSCEALYRFNCIGNELYKTGKFFELKLILDNYLIILNLLSTMDEEDQWIIQQSVELLQSASNSEDDIDMMKDGLAVSKNEDKLVCFDELDKEYKELVIKYKDTVSLTV